VIAEVSGMIRRMFGIHPPVRGGGESKESKHVTAGAAEVARLVEVAASGKPIRREEITRTRRLLESGNPFISAMGGDDG
jgi:hypothetical protein